MLVVYGARLSSIKKNEWSVVSEWFFHSELYNVANFHTDSNPTLELPQEKEAWGLCESAREACWL